MTTEQQLLIERAKQVRDEHREGANSAYRVGQLLMDMIELQPELPEIDLNGAVEQAVEQANLYTDTKVDAGVQLAIETAKEYTDEQVDAGVQLAIETAKQYTDEQVDAGVQLAVEQANLYTDIQIEAVRQEIDTLDDKYLRKDVDDTAQGHITFVQGLTAQSHSTFVEGITVYELAELMRLDVQELATIAQAVVQMMRSTRFVDGFTGEGYQIWQDIATGDWSMTLDRLTVRKVLAIYELIVQKIRSVGGMVVVSAANGKLKTVERIGSMYVLEMEDDCQFQPHDLMRCQVFSSNGLKYYWVEIADVQNGQVYVPVSEFSGVEPAVGDEVVLMGNTSNRLRQNLILISATEDGQPRFDCMDGVNGKSFEGCLKVRVGCLDGLSDSRFPADLQPQGYGLYGNNCYLTGVFVLSNGKDVQTMFSITEGLIKSEISSVRQEINEQDNYLSNAAFTANLTGWQYGQDIRVFTVSSRLLMFNRNLYSRKDAFAGIVDEGTKNVLRVKDSYICQLNADLNQHPTFDTYKDTETNEETGEEMVVREYRKARMFHVSFRYRCLKPGTLRILFTNEEPLDFDEYEPLDYSCPLSPTAEFAVLEASGKWNGTGDFYLSFDGDLYLYDLALSDNRLADVEEMFKSRFEQNEQKIQANLEHIIKTDTTVEEHYSEFLLTAEQMQLSFSSSISNLSGRLTTHTSSFHVSATKIESMVNATTSLEGRMTTAETKITQTASDITLLATKTELDEVSGDLTTHTGSFHVSATKIESMVNATTSLEGRMTTAETKITQTASDITLLATKNEVNKVSGDLATHTGSFHVSSDKISSMVSETNSLGTKVSTIEQTADSIQTKVQGLEGNYSSLNQTATEIQASVNNLDGQYASLKLQVDAIGAIVGDSEGSFSEFQQTLDSLTTTVAETKSAADAAKQAANQAAQNASNAQTTADKALDKAGQNATAIVQTNSSITALAGKFTFDENGNLTNISKSGLVLTDSFASLFSSQVDAKGIATQAYVATAVQDGISKATISADQIDLTGHVTFSMLASSLQGTLNGKVDTTTIIEGGYIKTSLIDVDNLVARKLEAGDSNMTSRIDVSGYTIKNYNGETIFQVSPYHLLMNGTRHTFTTINLWYREGSTNYRLYLSGKEITFFKNESVLKSILAEDE